MDITQNRAGFWTLMDATHQEQMHPLGNPLSEGRILYVQPTRLEERLMEPSATAVVVWDVGLGMGANAVAAIETHLSLQSPRPLWLYSFENQFKGFQMAVQQPEKFTHLDNADCRGFAEAKHLERGNFVWKLAEGDFFSRVTEAPEPDVIFFDPFSRKTNPSFWETPTFESLLSKCPSKPCVLATYANARAVRQSMRDAGWRVAVGPGFANRNATTLAVNPAEAELRTYAWWDNP
jgi:queuine tRNA-ribosyltransferase